MLIDFRNIMCDKDCSLFFLTQNPADIITDIEAGLIVECGERFIKQKKFRLQCESTDQGRLSDAFLRIIQTDAQNGICPNRNPGEADLHKQVFRQ